LFGEVWRGDHNDIIKVSKDPAARVEVLQSSVDAFEHGSNAEGEQERRQRATLIDS